LPAHTVLDFAGWKRIRSTESPTPAPQIERRIQGLRVNGRPGPPPARTIPNQTIAPSANSLVLHGLKVCPEERPATLDRPVSAASSPQPRPPPSCIFRAQAPWVICRATHGTSVIAAPAVEKSIERWGAGNGALPSTAFPPRTVFFWAPITRKPGFEKALPETIQCPASFHRRGGMIGGENTGPLSKDNSVRIPPTKPAISGRRSPPQPTPGPGPPRLFRDRDPFRVFRSNRRVPPGFFRLRKPHNNRPKSPPSASTSSPF